MVTNGVHALEHDERFLAALYNGLAEAVFVTQADTGRIVYWNRAAEAMFRYTAQEILGQTPEILYPDPTSFQRFLDLAAPVLQQGQSWHTELEYRRRPDERFPAEVTVTIFNSTETNATLMVHIIRDLKDRKQAAAALRARVNQLAVVAELGHRALMGTDPTQLIDDATALIIKSLGAEYSAVFELLPDGKTLRLSGGAGWKTKDIDDSTVDTDSPTAYPPLATTPVIVTDFRTDTRFVVGPLFHSNRVLSGVSVLIPGRDRPFGVLTANATARGAFSQEDVSFLQDVANILAEAIQRTDVEAELRGSKAQLRNLVHKTQDAFISIDRHGYIVLFNPAAEQMFGYTNGEILGRKVNLLMPEPYASEHDQYIERYERTREARAVGRIRSVFARRKNGEIFPIELSVTEVPVNQQVHYCAIIRDLSKKVQLVEDQATDTGEQALTAETSAFLTEAKASAMQTNARYKPAEAEARKEKFERISKQLHQISQILKDDILGEARGETDPFGRSLGFVEYALKDECGNPGNFALSELEDVTATSGYNSLSKLCKDLGLRLRLEKRESSASRHHAYASVYNCYVVVSGWVETEPQG